MSDVTEAVGQFRDAWNRHDADALAALWAEDGELNHPWGFRAVGRDAIRMLLEDEHRGPMAASELTIFKIETRASERSTLAEIDGVLAHVRAPNGREYDLDHKLSAMFEAAGDAWKLRTLTATPNPRR